MRSNGETHRNKNFPTEKSDGIFHILDQKLNRKINSLKKLKTSLYFNLLLIKQSFSLYRYIYLALSSLHGGSLEITLTVPLKDKVRLWLPAESSPNDEGSEVNLLENPLSNGIEKEVLPNKNKEESYFTENHLELDSIPNVSQSKLFVSNGNLAFLMKPIFNLFKSFYLKNN